MRQVCGCSTAPCGDRRDVKALGGVEVTDDGHTLRGKSLFMGWIDGVTTGASVCATVDKTGFIVPIC